MRATVGFVAVAALLALPSAAALDLQADLEVSGEAEFRGTASGTMAWLGSISDARLEQQTSNRFTFEGEAMILNYTFAIAERTPANPTGYGHDSRALAEDSWPIGRVSGTVGIVSQTDHASFRLLPAEPLALPLPGRLDLGISRDLHEQLKAVDDAQPRGIPEPLYPSKGSPLVDSSLPLANQSFKGRIAATGLLVAVGGQELDSRWSTTKQDVPGFGFTEVRETHVLVLEGIIRSEADLSAFEWFSVLGDIEGTLNGDLVLQNAAGTGTLNGSALPVGVHLFQAVGTMQVMAGQSDSGSTWRISGDADFVAVNARPVAGERWTWLAVEALAGAGVMAALGAVAVKLLRPFLGSFPGLNLADPLGNQKRLGILRLISKEPGVTTPRIAKDIGVPRVVARHHLSVLTRNNLISRRSTGSSTSYTLNNATFDFLVPGHASMTAGHALAHFTHPVRKRMLEALEALGESDHAGMSEWWKLQGGGVPNLRAVSYHGHKLLDLGLLGRRRVGKSIVWFLPFDRHRILSHQRNVYVRRGGYSPIIEALGTTPKPVALIQQTLAAAGRGMASADLSRSLTVLEVTGFVAKDERGYRNLTA